MSEGRSMVGRLHLGLTILLAGAIIALGVLLITGQIEIRHGSQPLDNPPKEDASAPATGPRFEQVKGAAEAFDLLGYKAYCFKIEGAWIDCWIEIDLDGKKTALSPNAGEQLRIFARAMAYGQLTSDPSIYLLWVRRTDNKEREVWDLAISLGKDEARYRTQISPPQVPGSGGYFDEVASDGTLGEGQEVVLASFLRTYEEQGRQITRRATLKCKAVK